MIAEYILHHLRLECDAIPPRGMHCQVAGEWSADTHVNVNMLAYHAGWRMHGERHICPTCLRRQGRVRWKVRGK
jgi:hypothetical protein